MQHVQKTTTTSKPRIPDISRPGGPATIWMGCRSKRLNNHWFYCVFVPACWTKTVALCCFRSQTFKNHWFHYLFAPTRWTNLSFIICSLQNVEQPMVLLRCRSKTLKKGRKRWKRASHGFRTWRRNDSPERKWGTLYRQAVWGMNNSSAPAGLRNAALTLRGMPPTLTQSMTALQGPLCQVNNRSGGQ